MAESTTTRFGLPRWTAGTDTPERTEFDGASVSLETLAGGFIKGTAAARPAASAAYDRFHYLAIDTATLSFCDGSVWADAGAGGGGFNRSFMLMGA